MERFITRSKTIIEKRASPLGAHLDDLAEHFAGAGYSLGHGRFQLRLAVEFGYWLEWQRFSPREIRVEWREVFLRDRRKRRGPLLGGSGFFVALCEVFRRKGLKVHELPADGTPAGRLIAEFDLYLRHQRRLAGVTVERYTASVADWLKDRFGDGPARLSSVSTAEVVAYVQRRSATVERMTAKLVVTTLRSFLQYARYRGYIRRDLAIGLPPVAGWSRTAIPRGMAQPHIRRVLASCDRRRAAGRRDYAILLLFARLGLRAGEVTSLTLEDIDWVRAVLHLRGKAGTSELPLPADVGEAIAAYLRRGRPPSASRRVFLRAYAPSTGLKTPGGVVTVVDRALRRAGIDSPRRGSHQFRHALATQMLRRGASLGEIGELLRHRNVQTTTIYAKVDLSALRTLVQPWLGGTDEHLA